MKKLICLILALSFVTFSFQKEDNRMVKYLSGYIIGFDPCTINHRYRIGYIIISTDLRDTVVTYNISDNIFTMPASVIINETDTLYKVPQSYFNSYGYSAYFPEYARNEFSVKITYIEAADSELNANICTSNINQSDFHNQIRNNQVIIKSATK